jgi:hypothetical protein
MTRTVKLLSMAPERLKLRETVRAFMRRLRGRVTAWGFCCWTTEGSRPVGEPFALWKNWLLGTTR